MRIMITRNSPIRNGKIPLKISPMGTSLAMLRITKTFTFLDFPLVEPTNNRAERQLRPYVIMRKITFGNRSALGASNQAVMMSIIQASVLNGIEPLDIFVSKAFSFIYGIAKAKVAMN